MGNGACGGFRLRGDVASRQTKSYLRVETVSRTPISEWHQIYDLCLLKCGPDRNMPLFHHNLFHILHRSQSDHSGRKKKKPRHKQNKLSKHSDLKRKGERRAVFKEKTRRLGLKKREKKKNPFPGNGHLSAVRASDNTRSVPSLTNIPLPISHADCDSYVFAFPFISPQ